MWRFALLLAASMLIATPALADPQRYYSRWYVEPTAAGEIDVTRGDFVIKSRLLPPGLIELTEDVIDPVKGNILAHAGEQLFEATGGRPMRGDPAIDVGVFCTFRPEKATSTGWLGPLTGTKRTVFYRCFADTDRDGRLDIQSGGSCTTKAFPIIVGKIPEKPMNVTGGAYRRLTPKDIKDGPMVGAVFTGLRNGGAPNLDLQFGDGQVIPSLFGSSSRGTKVAGQRDILGAKIRSCRAIARRRGCGSTKASRSSRSACYRWAAVRNIRKRVFE